MTIVNRITRWFYRNLVSKNVKNSLRLGLLLDGADKIPEVITDFRASHVVVLAPHIDDEVIGCGGTLYKHVVSGTGVTVVYLTDGRRGNRDLYTRKLSRRELVQGEDALALTRKSEAVRAAGIIGIKDQVFLNYPDGTLEATPGVVRDVRQLLLDIRPEIIYLPSLLDSHSDHWAANLILYAAFQGSAFFENWRPVCRGFEIWTPLPVNRLVDISDAVEIKKHALEVFESQTRHLNYVRAISSLNAYRSIHCQKGEGYAEAFYETSSTEYNTLLKTYLENRRHPIPERSVS